jgi:hypothetical protein
MGTSPEPTQNLIQKISGHPHLGKAKQQKNLTRTGPIGQSGIGLITIVGTASSGSR